MTRTHFLHKCFCFRLIGGFNNIPLVANFLLPRRVRNVAHTSTRSMCGFVRSSLGTTTSILPRHDRCTTASVKHTAHKTTLNLLKGICLCRDG